MASTLKRAAAVLLFSVLSAKEVLSFANKNPRNPSSHLVHRVPSSSSFSVASASASARHALTPTANYLDAVGGGNASTTTKKGKVSASTAALSTLSFVAMDVGFRRAFRAANLSFPSSLGGCGVLFAALLGTTAAAPKLGERAFAALQPGAAVLAKWLPVFFVPSLVTLPLAPSLGGAAELAKVAVVIVGGFYFSLLSTAGVVTGVRSLTGGSSSSSNAPKMLDDYRPKYVPPSRVAAKPKAFSDRTYNVLASGAVGSIVLSAVAARVVDASSSVVVPLRSIAMLLTTLATFVFGARLPSVATKIVHPLVTCTGLTWVGAALVGVSAGGGAFSDVLRAYRVGPSSSSSFGAGDALLFLLGPAVVALACQMYDRRALVRDNVAEVGAAVAASSVGGLCGTAALVRALRVADPVTRLSLLPRNITSPLAMAIASLLGGTDASLAVSVVVLSGLIGANFGARILDFFGVTDPVARGLGVGAAAHGLGTAAFVDEKDAFPFAAISMALTASVSTVLVSVAPFRRALRALALGGL